MASSMGQSDRRGGSRQRQDQTFTNFTNYTKGLWDTYMPDFFKSINTYLATRPKGFDKQSADTEKRKSASEFDGAKDELVTSLRAQGFGDGSGVTAGLVGDMASRELARESAINSKYDEQARMGGIQQALFLQSLLDPEGGASYEMGQQQNSLARLQQQLGLLGNVGGSLGQVDWSSLFGGGSAASSAFPDPSYYSWQTAQDFGFGAMSGFRF